VLVCYIVFLRTVWLLQVVCFRKSLWVDWGIPRQRLSSTDGENEMNSSSDSSLSVAAVRGRELHLSPATDMLQYPVLTA
jgi:hypothetical protein